MCVQFCMGFQKTDTHYTLGLTRDQYAIKKNAPVDMYIIYFFHVYIFFHVHANSGCSYHRRLRRA